MSPSLTRIEARESERAMGGKRREGSAVKTALVVVGGLGLAWITIETAFKPLLDRFRGAIARSDPACDDDDEDVPLDEPKEQSKDDEHKD